MRSTSLLAALFMLPAAAAADTPALYAAHCAACHGTDRLGAAGPALIPETLGRMRGPDVAAVIAEGRTATQMPAFADILDRSEIDALAAHLATPLEAVPAWSEAEIAASFAPAPGYEAATAPVHDADPMNLFLVVEKGDHHLSVLDGDRFTVLARLPTPFSVHGGPKFTPDGRFAFVMSRDGWVQKIDLWSLAEVARVRAAISSRNIAISRDGRWLAVANYLPRTLTILDTADLSVARIFEVADREGTPSRVSAVYQAPDRDSFVLALKDVAEIWEIATDPDAPPVYEGLVHSHEAGMVEAIASSEGLFARRRIALAEPLDDFFFTPGYRNLIGAARGSGRAVVVNLIVGREIA
ncbi:MAG: cytochrome D1 domain-containing protein, partial [Pseudomonadota bacterium]